MLFLETFYSKNPEKKSKKNQHIRNDAENSALTSEE